MFKLYNKNQNIMRVKYSQCDMLKPWNNLWDMDVDGGLYFVYVVYDRYKVDLCKSGHCSFVTVGTSLRLKKHLGL